MDQGRGSFTFVTIPQSCKNDFDPIFPSCWQAIGWILNGTISLPRTEMVAIRRSLGQVTYSDIIAVGNVPLQKRSPISDSRQEEPQRLNYSVINRISTSLIGDDYSFYQFNLETLRLFIIFECWVYYLDSRLSNPNWVLLQFDTRWL